MKAASSSFTFVGYKANIEKGTVIFSYKLQNSLDKFEFQEQLTFNPPPTYDLQQLKPALDNLLLMLGISYWKTYCPRVLVILPFTLTQKQAAFWNLVYTKGLGEFYYKNNIDYRGLVQFPYGDTTVENFKTEPTTLRSLVLLGGGKDSIVSAELFKQQKKEFSLFSVNPVPLQRKIAGEIGNNLIEVNRKLDPKLLELNASEGVYNGHIPISAVYAFISLFAARLYNFKYIVTSNEASSNYGNVSYLGQEINHQWSKSFEFEKEFQTYVADNVSKVITYFSLLRPISEVEVVRLFVNHHKYFSSFSSCNTNFKLSPGMSQRLWCGKCPKCAFVFLLLGAYLSKADMLSIFKKNLFTDEFLLATYKELLGVEGFKPFECVGTPQESLWALQQIVKKGEYNNDVIIKVLTDVINRGEKEIDVLKIRHAHAIPNEFLGVISLL